MSIVQTDTWLQKNYDNPVELCKQLEDYFPDSSPKEIYHYLAGSGMYRRPSEENKSIVSRMRNNHVWEIIQNKEKQLKALWQGPDVPVFIFPADPRNRSVQRDFHGKGGLTFPDKIFLFVSDFNSKEEMQALFTHEYNHACRMQYTMKNEANNRLLDSVIMEGLAEYSVREQIGKDYMADWTAYYSEKQLAHFWEKWIKSNKDMPKFRRRHADLLFGMKFYPKMLGYCVGYYLVDRFAQKKDGSSSKKLLHTPTKSLAGLD